MIGREAYDAFREAGMLEPLEIIADGKIHRYHSNAMKDSSNDSGWYVFYDSGDHVNGAFGDWSKDVTGHYSSGYGATMTQSEKDEQRRMIDEAIRRGEEERVRKQGEVAQNATAKWESLPLADELNGYIIKKGIKSAYGARSENGNLVLPLMDKEGHVWSLQTIKANGEKKYLWGGRCKGLFYCVGKDPKFLAEGFATAASVYEATGAGCLVAYSAGNLKEVAKQFPGVTIIADNDKSGTGETKAKEAGLPYILIPELGCDANDYAVKYGSETLAKVIHQAKGNSHKTIQLMDWISNIPPRQWLIKDWVLKGPALQMTFGASGSGKTFVNIDRMMNAALNGYKVLYLCGEGIPSAKARCKVWVQEKTSSQEELEILNENVYICEEEFKLDTPEGIRAINDIVEYYQIKPDLVLVDTLICFMTGDENDTQSAGLFISYCKEILDRYQCCLLLTHHTGLAEDAQKRARGSSAFRAALDMQDCVSKDGDHIVVEQTKNKGGRIQEAISFTLVDHEVQGLYEEDGETLQTCAVLVPSEFNKDEQKGKKLSAQELMTLEMFQRGNSYLVQDELRMRTESMEAYLRGKEMQKAIRGKDETDKAFEKRMEGNIRKAWSRLINENPLLVATSHDEKGKPCEYSCRPINLNGGVEPNLTWSFVTKPRL